MTLASELREAELLLERRLRPLELREELAEEREFRRAEEARAARTEAEGLLSARLVGIEATR